jgi:transcriptional regulator
MRENPAHACTDPEVVRALIEANPWATLVSENSGLVASHYPVLVDPEAEELTILSPLGRPDDELHGLGAGEMLAIVQGHHGYISPSWYSPQERKVPTWNFTVAHLHGTPQILGEEENLQVLTRLVHHFERRLEDPAHLEPEYAAPIAKGTVGLRIPVDRFELKRKLSQNRDEESRRNVIAALREEGPYRHPELADQMERELGSE